MVKGHTSAFQASYYSRADANERSKLSLLLNGIGNIQRINRAWHNDSVIPEPYSLHFEPAVVHPPTRAKRYLLRVINTSTDTTFIFSIDNHWLQVISADFVPIEPYSTTSVLIGIGQRYNLVVEAKPDFNGEGSDALHGSAPVGDGQNFWIRTFVASGCGTIPNQTHYEEAGILRYDKASTAVPASSAWPDIPRACADEASASLTPVLPWRVGNASNDNAEWTVFGNVPKPQGFPLAAFALSNTAERTPS